MKRLFYIAILTLVPFIISAQPDGVDCDNSFVHDWVKIPGNSDNEVVTSVATDASGNIIIVGYFSGTMQIGTETAISAGETDFFVAKFYPNGDLDWLLSDGGTSADIAKGVAVDNDGRINVIGNFNGTTVINGANHNSIGLQDIFLVQYSNDGSIIDQPRYLGSVGEDYASAIVTVDENNFAITGTFSQYMGIPGAGGGTLSSTGGTDFFIVKFKQDLSVEWKTSKGSTSNDYGTAIACDPNGNVIICGEFSGNVNFGSASITASGAKDVFVAKYNKDGNFEWVKKGGSAGDNDQAGSVAADFWGNAYFFYKSDIATNMAKVDKYSPQGTPIFAIGFGAAGNISPKDIAVDNSQDFYVSGAYSGITDFGDGPSGSIGNKDYFVAKFTQDGIFKYKDIAGSISEDYANSLCLDNSNSLIVGGYCSTSITFGSDNYDNGNNSSDILVVKYAESFIFGDFTISSKQCDTNNMCIEVSLINGTPPFTYYCDGIETSDSIPGLSTGIHQIVVVDDNNCSIETEVNLVAPIGPQIDLPTDIEKCPFDPLILDAGSGYATYQWSTGFEDVQSISINIPGIYGITVSDENGCLDSLEIDVTERQNLDLLVFDTIDFCPGEGFTIYCSYPLNTWSDGTSNQPEFTSSIPGFHSVMALVNGCHYYDSTYYRPFNKIELTPIPDKTICDGDSVILVADLGFESYIWSTGSENNSIWATETGIFAITATDINNCHSIDSINVGYGESPIIDLGDDFSICTNAPVILDPHAIGEGLTYQWMGNDLLGSPTYSVNNSGTYWVEVFSSGGCKSVDTINVNIFPQPSLNLGQDTAFCNGGFVLIQIQPSYESYLWSTGETAQSVIVSQTDDISVTVTNSYGCSDADTIRIIEYDVVDPFIGYDTTLCTGESHILRTSEDYHRYRWHNNSTAPTFTVTQPGTYAVTVYNNINCSASTSIEIEYQDGPQLINASAGGGIIRVNATGGTPPMIYSYDGDTWQTSNVFTGLESDTYTISIMDENYCMITVDVYLDQSLQIPDFFTPNADGYNDTWVITGLYHYPGATVEVFDRYGKKLYHSDGAQFSWNGIYAGLHLPSDTYWYVITLTEGLEPLTGSVTIKR